MLLVKYKHVPMLVSTVFLFPLPQGIKGIGCFWLRTSKQWRETDLNEAKTNAGKSFKKYKEYQMMFV